MTARGRARLIKVLRVALPIALLAGMMPEIREAIAAERASLATGSGTLPDHPGERWNYRVEPGDSLWSIAERFLGNALWWQKVQQVAGVGEPRRLRPGAVIAIPVAWMSGVPIGLEIVATTGSVTYATLGGGVDAVASKGTRIAGGTVVRTGPGSSATLQFDDSARLLLLADSELEIKVARRLSAAAIDHVEMRLLRGRAESLVPPRPGRHFEIETPAAVTSVRGTGFRVHVGDGPGTRVEVTDGAVDVRNPLGATRVPGRFGTVVTQDTPPAPPRPLPPAPDVTGLPALVDRVPIEFAPRVPADAVAFTMQVVAAASPDVILHQGRAPARLLRGPDLPDGQYVAHIRAVDAVGLQGLPTMHAFTLDARPIPPVPVEPTPAARVLDERPRFAWARTPEADRYHFQLAADSGFERLVHESAALAEPRLDFPAILPPGQYHWRVAGVDRDGRGPWTDPLPFRRLTPGPDAAPVVGADEITLSWRAGAPGHTWRLQFSGDDTFAAALVDIRTGVPRHAVPRPAPGRYFLRVSTIEPDGEEGPFGPVQILDVPPPPPAAPGHPTWPLLLPLLFLLIP